jgi:hypothetical protein
VGVGVTILTAMIIVEPAVSGAFSSSILFNLIIDSIVELNFDAMSLRESFS